MRYLIPSYLGVQIAVAHLLARKISDRNISILGRQFWQLVPTTLLLCGIISCGVSSQALYWWNKGAFQNLHTAQIINQSIQPLIVSSGFFRTDGSIVGNILSLSHVLDPKVRLQLTIEPEIPSIPNDFDFSNVFLYKPSDSLLRRVKQEYEIEPTKHGDDVWLWRIKEHKAH